jgi:hypothetical protein
LLKQHAVTIENILQLFLTVEVWYNDADSVIIAFIEILESEMPEDIFVLENILKVIALLSTNLVTRLSDQQRSILQAAVESLASEEQYQDNQRSSGQAELVAQLQRLITYGLIGDEP